MGQEDPHRAGQRIVALHTPTQTVALGAVGGKAAVHSLPAFELTQNLDDFVAWLIRRRLLAIPQDGFQVGGQFVYRDTYTPHRLLIAQRSQHDGAPLLARARLVAWQRAQEVGRPGDQRLSRTRNFGDTLHIRDHIAAPANAGLWLKKL